jgi:hypothetical protein
MTVAELIEKLKEFNPELTVYIFDSIDGEITAEHVELNSHPEVPVGVCIR